MLRVNWAGLSARPSQKDVRNDVRKIRGMPSPINHSIALGRSDRCTGRSILVRPVQACRDRTSGQHLAHTTPCSLRRGGTEVPVCCKHEALQISLVVFQVIDK